MAPGAASLLSLLDSHVSGYTNL